MLPQVFLTGWKVEFENWKEKSLFRADRKWKWGNKPFCSQRTWPPTHVACMMIPKDREFRSSVFFILQSYFSKVLCSLPSVFEETLCKRALTAHNLHLFIQKENSKSLKYTWIGKWWIILVLNSCTKTKSIYCPFSTVIIYFSYWVYLFHFNLSQPYKNIWSIIILKQSFLVNIPSYEFNIALIFF